MNAPQMHLVLNHFPIVGFALLCPLLLTAWFSKNSGLKSLSLLFVVAVGLLAVPAFWTGEPAEKSIQHLSGIHQEQIEDHEDAATIGLTAALITGALAAGVWFLARRRESMMSLGLLVVFLASLVTTALMAWVGHEGGQIRHPELEDAETATSVNETDTH